MQQRPKLGFTGWLKVSGILGIVLVAIVAAFFVAGFLLVIGLIAAGLFAAWSAITGRKNPLKNPFKGHNFAYVKRGGEWQDASGPKAPPSQPGVIQGDYESIDDKK